MEFGSNFQPFVRKRDVKDGDDADLMREPDAAACLATKTSVFYQRVF